MTQAITDIKELVGEMPGQPCEFRSRDDGPICGAQASWVARAHIAHTDSFTCTSEILTLCDGHKRLGLSNALMHADGSRCISCHRVMSKPSDLFGSVMPL